MVYDFRQLHATVAELDEPPAEVPDVGQRGVVDLRILRDARLFGVAYKTTDDQRPSGPATKQPPPPKHRPSPKSARRRSPPTLDDVKAFRKESRIPFKTKEELKFADTEARLRKSTAKLDRINYEIAKLHTRIQCLDPALKQRLASSGFQVEWDHLTEQLNKLNAEVAQSSHRFETEPLTEHHVELIQSIHRFEFLIKKRYRRLMDRIVEVDRKIDELEHPQTWWTDDIPKPLEWINQAMKSVKLP